MTLATAPAVSLTDDGRSLTVRFDRFDLDAYALFLRTKALPESELTYSWEEDAYTLTAPARFAALLGASTAVADRERLPLAEHLFDYQGERDPAAGARWRRCGGAGRGHVGGCPAGRAGPLPSR